MDDLWFKCMGYLLCRNLAYLKEKVIMWWTYLLTAILCAICVFLAYRRGYVKGKRDKQFRWRCMYCNSLMLSTDPEELLLASVKHMKEHTDGADATPAEGS